MVGGDVAKIAGFFKAIGPHLLKQDSERKKKYQGRRCMTTAPTTRQVHIHRTGHEPNYASIYFSSAYQSY